MSKSIFKNDRYKKVRGGYSRLLRISCEKCDSFICNYQKDGPGITKRMYLDRIIEPDVLVNKKEFSCPNGHIFGVKILYEKENRLAVRIFVGAINKKVIKQS